MHKELSERIQAVKPVDKQLLVPAQAHLDNLTKPRGSLGRLEELAARLYCVGGGQRPLRVDPARIFTVAGDHGVAAEGVSTFPQEVTRQMVLNFANGGAGINVLCKTAGVDLRVVDAGCLGGPFPEHPNLIQRKVAEGTANLSRGPAMDEETVTKALLLGMSLADEAHADGCRCIGTGDMGIANTTPSTALFAAYLGMDPATIVGPGTGLDHEGMARKVDALHRALVVNGDVVKSGDALAILGALGGLEIATLAGLIIGAASHGMVCAVDGFISTAAYTAAWKLCPAVKEYCVLSHASAEPGYMTVVSALGHSPLLHLAMRLGEGTGAALAIFLMRAAADIFNDMATFADAGVAEAAV